MRSTALLGVLIAAFSLFSLAGTARAQYAPGKGAAMMGEDRPSSSSGGMGQYRAFAVSAPFGITGEAVGRIEFNLAGKASLGLEGAMKSEREEISEEDQKETGESRRSAGKGAAVFVSRFMDGAAMAGLYWGLGAGYREETVRWRVAPKGDDKQVNMGLADKDRKLNHDAELKGTTGHFRVGYRYVPSDLPFVVGGYVGGRHFQAGVRDGDQTEEEEDDHVRQAPMTDSEKERLRRKYATKPEAGVELGFTF